MWIRDAENDLETPAASHALTVAVRAGDKDPDCSFPPSFVSDFALQLCPSVTFPFVLWQSRGCRAGQRGLDLWPAKVTPQLPATAQLLQLQLRAGTSAQNIPLSSNKNNKKKKKWDLLKGKPLLLLALCCPGVSCTIP